MSAYFDAELWMGGQVPRKLARKLCTVLAESGARLDWGDARFKPRSADELLGARQVVEDVPLLRVCDEEAPSGQFAQLEGFLAKHGIPFDRRSSGVYDYDPGLVQYRPGMARPQVFACNLAGERVIDRCDALVALELLQAGRQRAAQRAFKKLVGADIPTLPAFTLLN